MTTAVIGPGNRTENGTKQKTSPFQHEFEVQEQTQEQFVKSLDGWSSRKWLIRSPLSAHIRIDRRQNMRSFGVALTSLFERRHIIRDDEPYFGGELCRGEMPPRWSFIVSPPDSYIRQRREARIYADERVVWCDECKGTGLVIHKECGGTGRLPCPNEKCVDGMVTFTGKDTVTVRNPDGRIDTYAAATERERPCGRCHGVGDIHHRECNGSGKVECSRCLGTGKLLSFPMLVSVFTPVTDYQVINPTALPHRKIYRPGGWLRKEKLSGIMLVDRTGVELGEIPHIQDAVNASAEHLCAANAGDDENRLTRRTLRISFTPVVQSGYIYKRSHGMLCVFGDQKDVYRAGRLPLHLRNVLIAALSSLAVMSAIAYLMSLHL